MQANIVQDAALTSTASDWGQTTSEDRPVCPLCGSTLITRGRRRNDGKHKAAERSPSRKGTESVPRVRVGFFPLDEQLGLVAGSLSPSIQDHVVHVAMWMPFGRAVQMLKRYTGVQLSEATALRHTYEVGKAAMVVQDTQESQPSEAEPTGKLIVSPDGAIVSLLNGVWAKVKTVAVGEVEPAKSGESVHSTKLSSYSHMLEVETLTE